MKTISKPAKTANAGITSSDDLLTALREDKQISDGSNLRRATDGQHIVTIPTGIETLDGVIGRGGLPRSRMVTFSGKEGGGKTTAALATVAAFQKRGGIGLYIDAEHKLDLDWAVKNGVDLEHLITSNPLHLERAFHTIEEAVTKTDPAVPLLIVLDSITAGLTKGQMDAGYEDQPTYGPQPRVLATSIPKLMPHLERSGATFMLISQIREKMNAGYTISGGNPVKFYSCLILTFEQFGKVMSGGKKLSELRKLYPDGIPDSEMGVVGCDFAVKAIKNQIAPPFRESMIRIDFKRGIDKLWCLHKRAEETQVIVRAGAWYSFTPEGEAEVKWQGADAFRDVVKARPELMKIIRKAVRKA